MPLPKLSADFVRSILDYDPKTGVLLWKHRPKALRRWNSRHAGKIAGYRQNGYLVIQVGKGNNYRAHHLAWVHLLFCGHKMLA